MNYRLFYDRPAVRYNLISLFPQENHWVVARWKEDEKAWYVCARWSTPSDAWHELKGYLYRARNKEILNA